MEKQGKNKIIVGITASIAAYRSCDIIKSLVAEGYCVTAVMTKDAEHFITPLSLSVFSGKKVYRDMFSEQHAANPCFHIGLAEEAGAVLIAPATADFIAKAACGIADNLLLAILLSTKAKVFIVPAMNAEMYKHPATQQNLNTLRDRGVLFIGPTVGPLACRINDMGHIEETPAIVSTIKNAFPNK